MFLRKLLPLGIWAILAAGAFLAAVLFQGGPNYVSGPLVPGQERPIYGE